MQLNELHERQILDYIHSTCCGLIGHVVSLQQVVHDFSTLKLPKIIVSYLSLAYISRTIYRWWAKFTM